MTADILKIELDAARYIEDPAAKTPGTFAHDGARFTIARRAFVYLDGREREKRIAVTLADGRVAQARRCGQRRGACERTSGTRAHRDAVRRARGRSPHRAARRGADVAGDRSAGASRIAISSTITASIRSRSCARRGRIFVAGHVVQGGSTLTQQLVKNLFLDRGQSFSRKFNEALLSLIIEARYGKERILDAYINEVFLGQEGGQAVHGFAAASEFYFGRDLRGLGPADIALLVGMVQGPSYYDPRRNPDRALGRRNVVLGQFHDTGLIDDATYAVRGQAAAGHRGERDAAARSFSGVSRSRAPADPRGLSGRGAQQRRPCRSTRRSRRPCRRSARMRSTRR